MPSHDKLVEYFIEQTNERLVRVESKVDDILAFKWQIIGGSLVASVLINLLFGVVAFILERYYT